MKQEDRLNRLEDRVDGIYKFVFQNNIAAIILIPIIVAALQIFVFEPSAKFYGINDTVKLAIER